MKSDDHIIEVDIEGVNQEQVEVLEPVVTHNPHGHRHHFVRQAPTEAMCSVPGCGAGIFLNPTDRIEDGLPVHAEVVDRRPS